MKPRLIVTLVLLLLVLLFAIQNSEIVELEFLFWDLVMPRSVLIFVVLTIGVVTGWFVRSTIRIVKS